MKIKHEVCGFEHLHRHTMYSMLDGYATPGEYAAYSAQVNQKFLCISDHGMMGAVPNQIKVCDEHGLNPIFACELYVNPYQPELEIGQSMTDFTKQLSPEERQTLRKSGHLLAIAATQEGYKNLVHLSSWAWLHGFYYKPRVNHEQLLKHKEGIIFCTACYNGEIGQAFDNSGEEEALEMARLYKSMFGDSLYLEFMLLDFDKQKPYNSFLMKAHDKLGIPLVVTNDCHYCKEDDSIMQQYLLMIQTKKTLVELKASYEKGESKDLFELQDKNLWMKSESELDAKWESDYSDIVDYEIYKEAKRNSVHICEKAKGVELDRSIKLPKIENEDEMLKQAVLKGFKEMNLPDNQEYIDRIKEEYNLICQKEFSSYFLIQKMMTDEARRYAAEKYGTDGSEAVGPGRGSGAGALVNYCLGITDVDPIAHDLMFSRFMSPARGGKAVKLRFNKSYASKKIQIEEMTEDSLPWDQTEENESLPWAEDSQEKESPPWDIEEKTVKDTPKWKSDSMAALSALEKESEIIKIETSIPPWGDNPPWK